MLMSLACIIVCQHLCLYLSVLLKSVVVLNICSENIDLIHQLWETANDTNATFVLDDDRSPVLHVGQYATISLPLHQVFGYR